MARLGIGFNHRGRFTAFPEVLCNVNADDLTLRPQGITGAVAILGEGAGFFEPQKASILPLDVGSPQRFIATSDLLTSANFGSRPFPELDRSPGIVYVVPVTAATKATLTIEASGAVALGTLSSKGWGIRFNAILGKSETGKYTITLPSDRGNIVEVYNYSTVQGLVDEINARSGIVEATFTAEGTPVTHANLNFTGGTEPAATNADWAEALNALNPVRVNTIHVASSDSAIWTMLSDYAIQRRARGFVGRGLQNWNGLSNRATAITNLKADAALLNAQRMMHVGLGGDGEPGYLSAARYAALAAALDPSTPMTLKHLGFQSLEAILDIRTEVAPETGLLIGGVAAPVPDPQSLSTYVVSRGLSTYTGSDNLYDREHSVLAAVDAVEDLLEAAIRDLLGAEGTIAAARRAVARVDDVLEVATRPTSTVRILAYDRSSIVATLENTVLRVAADITPILPINFAEISLRLLRTSITVTASAPLT
jgi:hypothetical protein